MSAPDSALVGRTNRLTRDGTAELVSRDQLFRRERETGETTVQQPYPVDPFSAISDDHTYIHMEHRKTIAVD